MCKVYSAGANTYDQLALGHFEDASHFQLSEALTNIAKDFNIS